MKSAQDLPEFPDTIGLVPAAGRATRIGALPFSKELFPIWTRSGAEVTGPLAVCEILLANMRSSGVLRAYVILRRGKWDIPAYLGTGDGLGIALGYLLMGLPYGVPYTLDQAYQHVGASRVALGFPDILFDEGAAFRKCLSWQNKSGADVVLGAFPTAQPSLVDMLDMDEGGRVRGIVIKPVTTTLRLGWAIAVWTPSFTDFMHRFLVQHASRAKEAPELFLGDVVQAAIDRGMNVEAVQVSERPFLDIGTPEGLARSLSYFRD